MGLQFLQYDVFTAEPLTGNQLAVFLDGRGLSDDRMQAIAREMNFSESTFILPAASPGTDIRMRIFTPGIELPMAGHPTIGSTFALAHTGVIAPGTSRVVFGLNIGPTPVDLEWTGPCLRFAWMTQRAPEFWPPVDNRAGAATMLGLSADDLAPGLPVQQVSCGVPYLLIPLRDREAVDRATTDAGAVRRFLSADALAPGLLLFAVTAPPTPAGRTLTIREASHEGSPHERMPVEETVYSRMLAPQFGIAEDPATGSASGPLGAYLVRHGVVSGVVSGDAARRMLSLRIVNLQGVAMKRPSRIHIAIEGTPASITSVKVGGEAVLVAKGELLLE